MLDEVDRAYSRFRPDAELTTVNAQAGRTISVSPLLARAIEGSLEAARSTGGAVDPTVGRAMRRIGYDADFDLLRRGPAARAAGRGRSRLVRRRVRRGRRTVRVPIGVELDLGSTGKGLAADLAADAALAAAGPGAGVLVSLGGDIATAGRPPDGGWRILIADDSATSPDGDGELIAIEHGAVATSSTTVRRWRSASRRHGASHRRPANRPVGRHAVAHRLGRRRDRGARQRRVDRGDRHGRRGAGLVAAPAGLPARLVANDGAITRLGGWPEPATTIEADSPPVTGPKGRARDTRSRDLPPARGRSSRRSRAQSFPEEPEMFDQVLWFATRGAGAVSLLMFTAATCLGLVTVTRFQAHRLAALLQLRDAPPGVAARDRLPRGPRPRRRLRPVHVPRHRRRAGAAGVDVPADPGRARGRRHVPVRRADRDQPPAQAHRAADLAPRPLVVLRDVAARRRSTG